MKVTRLSALCTRRLYPKEIFLVIISVTCWVYSRAKMWLEGLRQWKLLMVPSGIEPVTFQLVAQCLHQLCHPMPPKTNIIQFTFASTYYNMTICDTQKFSTRSELHNSKQRTHDVSPEKVHKLNSSSLLSNTIQLQPPYILYIHDGCPASPPTSHGILYI